MVGIDNQPRYPYQVIQADAVEWLRWAAGEIGQTLGPECVRLHEQRAEHWTPRFFDLIHASPPCQDHSVSKSMSGRPNNTGWMLPETIRLLCAFEAPRSGPRTPDRLGRGERRRGGATPPTYTKFLGEQIRDWMEAE